jgi:hypothetical protein
VKKEAQDGAKLAVVSLRELVDCVPDRGGERPGGDEDVGGDRPLAWDAATLEQEVAVELTEPGIASSRRISESMSSTFSWFVACKKLAVMATSPTPRTSSRLSCATTPENRSSNQGHRYRDDQESHSKTVVHEAFCGVGVQTAVEPEDLSH